jgi:hypothetical protein
MTAGRGDTSHVTENRLDRDLYPLPGKPSEPPTWEDIERLALHYPAAQAAVTLVERGDLTREQALVVLAYALADAFARIFTAEVEKAKRSSAPAIGLSDEYWLAMAALDQYPIDDGLPKSTSVVFRIHQLGHAWERLKATRGEGDNGTTSKPVDVRGSNAGG